MGVLKDYHTHSLRDPIRPVAIGLRPYSFKYLYLKLGDGDQDDTLAFIERTWNALLPQRPFEFVFMEDQLNDFLYNREQQLGRMFRVFAILAILVACLGLFGLTAFMTEQRTKEIGIRKVLAASVPDIVLLMSRDFLFLVLIGNVIACPFAFFGMRRWLEDFAYHVDLGIGTFLLGVSATLVLAVITVSAQAYKAAVVDPVRSIRTE